MCQLTWASPAPSTRIGFLAASFARAPVVRTTAPPPSVSRQQSSLCRGSLIMGDSSTSSMVSGSRDQALGLSRAHSRAATATSASCSAVVPY